MKKMFLFLMLFFISLNVYAARGNLHEKFKNHPEIKIYLMEVINDTENPEIETEIFKKFFKETIEKRVNIKFVYVERQEDADVAVVAKIKKYAFEEKALPMITSVWTATADMTAPKSSASLTVDYEIVEPLTGKALLFYKNFTTNERKPRNDMSGDMGYAHSIKKNVNRFIFRAFYKPREN